MSARARNAGIAMTSKNKIPDGPAMAGSSKDEEKKADELVEGKWMCVDE